ncbi:hypothetical protein ACFP51_08955 [Streptomyces pratens]|uniref:Integrase catalytic domain-containing protein n=1 Tax=Streptomyces pratens TaxID=887456 RepID=A0ABW1LSH4_9ACTN
MADHHRADLVVEALDMAAGRGHPEPGCITHTDCGSAYTSAQFRTRVEKLKLRQSMGRIAAAESFLAVLKEGIGTRVRTGRATARADIFIFIETFHRVQGELARLGLPIVSSAVWKILNAAGLDPAPRRTGPTWRDSLTAQADSIVAADFFHLDAVLRRRPRCCSAHPGRRG